MRRFFVRLLVLLVVPVVWLGYHAPAQAATSYGDPATGNFKHGYSSNVPLGDDVACTIKGAWATDALSYSLSGGFNCKTGYNVSSADVALSLVPGGSGPHACGPLSTSLGQVDGNGSGTWTMGAATAVPEGCNVAQMCYTIGLRTHTMLWEDTRQLAGCFDFPAGAPPENDLPVAGECQYGTVAAPVVSAPVWAMADGEVNPGARYHWQAHVHGSVTAKDTRRWFMYVVVRATPNGDGYIWWNTITGLDGQRFTHYGQDRDLQNGQTLPFDVNAPVSANDRSAASPTKPLNGEVIGVGYVYRGSQGNSGVVNGSTVWDSPRYIGQTRVGPDQCRFYYGEKLADVPGTTDDDPLAPLAVPGGPGGSTEPPDTTPEPVPDGDKCEFSFTNPTTWVSSGICQLVRLIGSLIQEVTELPGKIAGAFGALFIPDDGFFEDKGEQLATAWDDTAPGAWVGAIKDQSIDVPSGGCNGLHVEWTVSGKTSSFDLLKACDGFMATAASVVKIAATGFLVLFGALGCVRAVGSGFGWNPGVGRGGGGA